jgi:hypothetical protein
MSVRLAETLVKEILDNTYKPSTGAECKIGMPKDRNPQTTRFIQPMLFAQTGAGAQRLQYRVLRPGGRRGVDPAALERATSAMAKRLVARMKEAAKDAATNDRRGGLLTPGRRTGGNEKLDAWRAIRPLQDAGFVSLASLPAATETPEDIVAQALRQTLSPAEFQSLKSPHPHIALCLVLEQAWDHRGYTRGELINNLSLAPGEQLTLELHSWDKSTIKNEEELAIETELRVSEKLTERDSLTVIREVSTKIGVASNFSAQVPLPYVTLGGSTDLSVDVDEKVTSTSEQARERTDEASNTLKNTRKMRIEVAREVGREQKQTRVIANTNRCHTLNCLYFEVFTNYLVTTSALTLQPCLLLPLPAYKVTPAWVLCHEDLLKQVLLSKTFLPGFDAARVLEIDRILHEEAPVPPPDDPGGGGGGPVTPPGGLGETTVDDILDGLRDILDDTRWVEEAEQDWWDVRLPDLDFTETWGGLDLAAYVAVGAGLDRLGRVLAFAAIAANAPAMNALRKMEANRGRVPGGQLLSEFAAAVRPRDFRAELTPTSLAAGLAELGIDKEIVDALVAWGFLDLVPVPGALHNSVQTALAKMSGAAAQARRVIVARASETDAPEPAAPAAEPPPEGYSRMELARARVDFEQLKCHIEDHWLHYFQALWLREDPAERVAWLAMHSPIAVSNIRNEIIGFVGNKAAYPLISPEIVTEYLPELPQALKDFELNRDRYERQQLVTVPAQATVLEAVIGECDACEDFIQQSRAIELRSTAAKALQEEEEARRRTLRLNQDPPDLDDPRVGAPGGVVINMAGAGGNEPPE